ncbi:exo-beta-N-acetylmuramidase NamZ domain-containing protein [Maribacter sp. HTCC2170]|uniref:exo-beta-N-acetylmuramidase NamZ family protein n=1 Tax=Maribacter sp. (strain HTCC2170 / KCCM 42371) TaxID=313603 RepID=UPI00006B6E7D|nr:DUF1343 domain-containing protein [Maribacter sp. HTCC2170]EAQ99672.1 hypothetical protein FB2170_01891 [Maribacter sp. HTCC2170]
MNKVATGLEVLVNDSALQQKFKGNIALLCHNASIDANYTHAATEFKNMFGSRFTKLFGPQHGFSTDAQDNMIETDHFVHPYFEIPVYSLYSETRIPTDEMLERIDHLFVDLQDVGCRMYTYIYTLTLLLDKCADKEIEVIVLDRPNPLNGIDFEGNMLDVDYASFIGLHPIPVRHGMTIGEVGLMHQKYWAKTTANYRVIRMENWERSMFFEDTGLPWLLPSPNLARPESAYTFPGMVLFEGTELSEGRGTTQSLEIVGHPKIEPFSFYENHLKDVLKKEKPAGLAFRPITFLPTFQKQANAVCGGLQIHITDKANFKPWKGGQLIMRELYHYLGEDFKWKQPPYEYDYTHMPIDIINGTDKLRHWVENNGDFEELDSFENFNSHQIQLEEIKIY